MDAPNLGLPLIFMYEGVIYSKQMDGCFHGFEATKPRVRGNQFTIITMGEAKELFQTSKWIGTIIVLSNDVNIKI